MSYFLIFTMQFFSEFFIISELYSNSHLFSYTCRWNKLIQKPYENGDMRGLQLVKAILRPLMLRRTKESKDKEGR